MPAAPLPVIVYPPPPPLGVPGGGPWSARLKLSGRFGMGPAPRLPVLAVGRYEFQDGRAAAPVAAGLRVRGQADEQLLGGGLVAGRDDEGPGAALGAVEDAPPSRQFGRRGHRSVLQVGDSWPGMLADG